MAEFILTLKGKPLDLRNYRYLHQIYDDKVIRTLLKTGRQVAKTTTLGNIMILRCNAIDHYNSCYAAPLKHQAYKFSNLNIKPVIKYSPLLQPMLDPDALKNVLVRSFSNGSRMEFLYIENGVDRIRGTTADELNWDEIQDILWDNVPVVEQIIKASSYKFQRYCGTPKTLENSIEYLWMQSTRFEWVMKCPHCGKDNVPILPDILEMIDEKGPVCFSCKKLLDIQQGIWIAEDPSKINKFHGYHIPQIIVPFNLQPKEWEIIFEQFKTYARYRFINEVLGISYDTGGRLITLSDLNNAKIPKRPFNPREYSVIAGGVDWGISAQTSFTVLTILGAKSDGKFEVIAYKKFLTGDILDHIREIARMLTAYGASVVGCDFGIGWTNNQLLRQHWSPGNINKVCEYQYCRSNHFLIWNKKCIRYMLHRTESLNMLFLELKKGNVKFQEDAGLKEVFDDILAEYEEIIESGSGARKQFTHSPEIPDDYLHALNFAYITAKRASGQLLINYNEDFDV